MMVHCKFKLNTTLQIHIANGDHFIIDEIGDIPHSLPLENVLSLFSFKSTFPKATSW